MSMDVIPKVGGDYSGMGSEGPKAPKGPKAPEGKEAKVDVPKHIKPNDERVLTMDLGSKDGGMRMYSKVKRNDLVSVLKNVFMFWKSADLLITESGDKIDIDRNKTEKGADGKEKKVSKSPEDFGKEVIEKAMEQAWIHSNEKLTKTKEQIFAETPFKISASSWARKDRNDPVIAHLKELTKKYPNMTVEVLEQPKEAKTSKSAVKYVYKLAKLAGITPKSVLPVEGGGGSSQQRKLVPEQKTLEGVAADFAEHSGTWGGEKVDAGQSLAQIKNTFKEDLSKDLKGKVPDYKENIPFQGLFAVAMRDKRMLDLLDLKDKEKISDWNQGKLRLPIADVMKALNTFVAQCDDPANIAANKEGIKKLRKNEDIQGLRHTGISQACALAWLEVLQANKAGTKDLYITNISEAMKISIGKKYNPLSLKAAPTLGLALEHFESLQAQKGIRGWFKKRNVTKIATESTEAQKPAAAVKEAKPAGGGEPVAGKEKPAGGGEPVKDKAPAGGESVAGKDKPAAGGDPDKAPEAAGGAGDKGTTPPST